MVRAALLRWFAAHRRPLPWRKTCDPYRIWISEIMLQQTRVGAVLEHYAEFLRRFPDLDSLAAARLHDVLAAWSGLGYYRRARALHRAARIIVRDHGGNLPGNADALQSLPGIGRYTASAIASIAFHEPCAVVDGNVERVLRRLLGWRKQPLSRIWNAAQQLLSRQSPGNFNQAMMELGALVCLPVSPRCEACPVRRLCATCGPLQRPARPPRKTAEITYGLAARDDRVYLVRRGRRESLMPGMWELPQLNGDCAGNGAGDGAPHLPGFGGCGSLKPDFTLRHSITVTDHTVHVCRVPAAGLRGGRWFRLQDAPTLPLTGLARRILRRAALI
ncbi:MAG: A/G-specific adenine glycosylase [Acidobacteriia bacterium]|nr:A/G-specific adenine glycosylase [Terriglobia bacterium]